MQGGNRRASLGRIGNGRGGGAPGSGGGAAPNSAGGKRRDKCLNEIERLRMNRESRRARISNARVKRDQQYRRNVSRGNQGDVDFQRMVSEWRAERENAEDEHTPPGDLRICIAVRKRPINAKEIKKQEFDAISCLNPRIVVHDAKLRVDGITKYLDNNEFAFDHTFHEASRTEEIYELTVAPLIDFVLTRQGRATCFAYGQTGSGKTFTMEGVQEYAAQDLFQGIQEMNVEEERFVVGVSFFEIYGARVQDLLNRRHRLAVREDGKGEVCIAGLEEVACTSCEELHGLIEAGNRIRTTHATESNDTSSRSHAICQIHVRRRGSNKLAGKLSLIDLAGSERAGDTKSNNRQRRLEGAEINKSLLALKECIRALDGGSSHVPYRASKLTMVLKDSFTGGNKARTVMIATVSPGSNSADHSINTLRYADRIKEKAVLGTQMLSPGPAADAKNEAPPSRSRFDAKDKDPYPSEAPSAPGSGFREDAPPEEKAAPRSRGSAKKVQAQRRVPPPTRNVDPLQQSTGSAEEDMDLLGASIRQHSGVQPDGGADVVDLHRTVAGLFDEEEALLNMHMSVIQENAELLTEEGRLLSCIQGEDVVDYDIDAYAQRLDAILSRKAELITQLQAQLQRFRRKLAEEERVSQRVRNVPQY